MLGPSWVVGIGGLLAMFSFVSTSVIGQSRIFFTMAERGDTLRNIRGPPALRHAGLHGAAIGLDNADARSNGRYLQPSDDHELPSPLSHTLINLSDLRLYLSRRQAPFKPLHAVLGAILSRC